MHTNYRFQYVGGSARGCDFVTIPPPRATIEPLFGSNCTACPVGPARNNTRQPRASRPQQLCIAARATQHHAAHAIKLTAPCRSRCSLPPRTPASCTLSNALPFSTRACSRLRNHQALCCFYRSLPPCSLMSSGFSWADACANARERPLQTLLDALYASCGVTVR